MAQSDLNIGATCTSDAQCLDGGANSSCWTLDSSNDASVVRRCHCDRTYVACGNACVHLGTDGANCGGCGISCDGGTCVNGLCGGSLPDAGWSADLGSVDQVNAFDSSVASWAHEGAQEFSLTQHKLYGMTNYNDSSENDGGNHPEWNSATIDDAGVVAWGTAHQKLPVIDGGFQGFDTSAATSGWSGYEYLASIFKTPVPDGGVDAGVTSCLGVASTQAAGFSTWTAMMCANLTTEAWDAPFLAADIAGSTMWLSGCSHDNAKDCYLYKNDNCAGAIGTGCTTPFTPVTPGGLANKGFDHSHHIVANRCDSTTAGAFMATRTKDHATIQLTQFFADNSVRTCSIFSDEPFTSNTGCVGGGTCDTGDPDSMLCKCGGATTSDCSGDPDGATCGRIASWPNIDLKVLDDHCYVYVAWDKTISVAGIGDRTMARLARIDVPTGGITDGGLCISDISDSANCPADTFGLCAPQATWGSNVRASKTSNNLIWEFYDDTSATKDACTIDFYAYVDINLDFSTKKLVRLSTASFPFMIPPLAGGTMGDLVSIAPIGLPGGVAYPTWAASTTTTNANGVPCNGSKLNLRLRGRTVKLR